MERAGKEPLLPTGLFRSRTSNLGLVTQNVQWLLLLLGISFVVSVFLQTVRGYNAIQAGVIFTAATVGILVSSLAAERLAGRRTQKTLILAGFVTTICGIGLLIGLVVASDSILAFLPGLLLIGLGLGVMLTPSVNVVQSAFPRTSRARSRGCRAASPTWAPRWAPPSPGPSWCPTWPRGTGPTPWGWPPWR
jgi:MFS family permease